MVNLAGAGQRLKDKVSIVTGGAQGIGLATVRKFALEGAIVAVADLKAGAVDGAVAAMRKEIAGARVEGHVVDVTQRGQIDAMVAQLKARHGRIDVLVNNAGITLDARLQKMTEAQFDQVIAVNLKGTYNCAQAVVYGNFGQSNYAASKFGVIGLAKTWARELGPKGIRANAVCPGFIATPILHTIPDKVMAQMVDRVPLRRLGQPEEVANLYAFLASDEASYINGAVIEVAGGLTV
jgi:3-oxoacyl-[acyl-carrier protein] reductase